MELTLVLFYGFDAGFLYECDERLLGRHDL